MQTTTTMTTTTSTTTTTTLLADGSCLNSPAYFGSIFLYNELTTRKMHEKEHLQLLNYADHYKRYDLSYNAENDSINTTPSHASHSGPHPPDTPDTLDTLDTPPKELDLTTVFCYAHLLQFLKIPGTAFHMRLRCIRVDSRDVDSQHVPVIILDVLVDTDQLNTEWTQKQCFTGEKVLTAILEQSLDKKALFFHEEFGHKQSVNILKKRKRHRELRHSQIDALHWMTSTERRSRIASAHENARATMDNDIDGTSIAHRYSCLHVQNTCICFCPIEKSFMSNVHMGPNGSGSGDVHTGPNIRGGGVASPQPSGNRHRTNLASASAGLLLGERNAGKSMIVKELIEQEGPNVAPLSSFFLRRIRATLLVVPHTLMFQWLSIFQGVACRVLCIHDNKTMKKYSAQDFVDATIVIVSHKFYLSSCLVQAHKMKCRLFAADVNHPCLQEDAQNIPTTKNTFALNWFLWERIVVDELLLFCVDKLKFKITPPQMCQTHKWWGLQGGVHESSTILLSFMMNTMGLILPFLDINTCLRHFVYFVPALEPLVSPYYWEDRTVLVDLTEHEIEVYKTLVHLDAPETNLGDVCAGDLTFMDGYMTTVPHWIDAIPIGIEAINHCLMFDVINNNNQSSSEYTDDTEQDEEQQHPNHAIDDSTVVVVVRDAAPNSGNNGRVNDSANEAFIMEHSAKIAERRDYFLKTAMQLSNKEITATTCSICLVNACDCICVCGHLLCHTCMIDLFHSTMDENMYPDLMAPCPTCRWNIEPNEVIWVLNKSIGTGSKFKRISTLLDDAATRNESTVIFATDIDILTKINSQLVALGKASRVLSSAYKPVRDPDSSSVLLVPYYKTFGLKLEHIKNVIFLNTPDAKPYLAEQQALACMMQNDGGRLTVHRLVAVNTVEHALAGITVEHALS